MNREALEESLKYIESWLDFRYKYWQIPGIAVAIRHKNKLVYSKAFGLADVKKKQAMTTSHIFRIASHSKMFTATAIMQLQEAGELRIDDYAVDYLPWLKKHKDSRWQKVTLRQLLSHSAGVIRDGLDADYWAVEKPFPTSQELREMVLASELVYDNNVQMKYSNFGFSLLGQVIEAVSGEPYNTYVTDHILQPLELKDIGPEYVPNIRPKLAVGYSQADVDNKRLPIDNVDTRGMSAATGFYATAEALSSFAAAHFWGNGTLLSDESKKEMQRAQWKMPNSHDGSEYGLGFSIKYVDGHRLVGHGGGFPGYATSTLFDPQSEIAVTTLTNAIDGSGEAITRGIIQIIDWFAAHYIKQPQHSLKDFSGRFMTLWTTVDIVSCGDTIVSLNPIGWMPFGNVEELEYLDPRTLKITKTHGSSSEGELIHYEFANGKVKKISNAGSTMLPEKDYLKAIKGKTIVSLPN